MIFRKIDKILTADGWCSVRVLGSHHRYHKIGMKPITVPDHNGQDLTIGVLKDIRKKNRFISSEINLFFFIFLSSQTAIQKIPATFSLCPFSWLSFKNAITFNFQPNLFFIIFLKFMFQSFNKCC